METLFVLNKAPYGLERTYNGLHLAGELAAGTHRGTMEDLSDWTEWADRVLVFGKGRHAGPRHPRRRADRMAGRSRNPPGRAKAQIDQDSYRWL